MEEKIEWEVSIMELQNDKKRYKVTRRLPQFLVSETKLFYYKKNALRQFKEWLE